MTIVAKDGALVAGRDAGIDIALSPRRVVGPVVVIVAMASSSGPTGLITGRACRTGSLSLVYRGQRSFAGSTR